MAKHDFESDTLTTHDIMHCTLVYKVPGPDTTIVSISDSEEIRDFEVPTRPTGAHRHETVPVDVAVYVTPHVIECPRGWNLAEPFEFIPVPSI